MRSSVADSDFESRNARERRIRLENHDDAGADYKAREVPEAPESTAQLGS